ncbi:MAG: hypothetical protein QM817_00800 [Archangium sp.]
MVREDDGDQFLRALEIVGAASETRELALHVGALVTDRVVEALADEQLRDLVRAGGEAVANQRRREARVHRHLP